MAVWIIVGTVLFLLGSFMALKPSGIDVRLDKLRMAARKLELHPKLITCPDWIRGKGNELGRGMMGQYSLVLDDMKFAETRYQVIEGKLRPVINVEHSTVKHNTGDSVDAHDIVIDYTLDFEPLELPERIAPFVKAVYTKANSLVVFWDDSSYVKPTTNPDYQTSYIEPDLLALKIRMMDWAEKLSQKGTLS